MRDRPRDEPEAATRDRRPRLQTVLRLLRVGAVLVVLALIAVFAWRIVDKGRGAELVTEIEDGSKPAAPEFALPVIWDRFDTWPENARAALVDGSVSLRELRGYPVVINFWASWCGPCKDEAPRLDASSRAHRGRVIFLGIDVQDFESDARRFLRRFDTPYVSVRDGGGSTYDDYGLTGVPETYWLDARGRIVAHYAGAISREQLEEGIRLAEASR
jgi:cytochrome c biogenesis protein CcmG/thiol:disulfide interchange protein DsbE